MPAPSLSPSDHPFLRVEGVRKILAAIKSAGGEARFVGGCVRDALAGRTVGDIDLACNLPPEKTSEALIKAGLKVSPTGIDHGTVTAIADHKGYEITTLRRDVETYGRKAKVEYTDDWLADAGRRDFTMNAIYADEAGAIYDYFNGAGDLDKGHVRFIGKPEDRIKEDVLRILRFFRFYAWFGKGAADNDGLEACAALAPELPKLSAERVWREVGKFLTAANPVASWQLMIAYNILPHLLPEALDVTRLETLIEIEKKFGTRAAALTRFAALLPADGGIAAEVAKKLKLSNRESEQLVSLATLPARMRGKLDIMPFRRMLYDYGADTSREAAMLFAASEHRYADLEPALMQAAEWQKPAFPVQGDDLIKLGLQPGPKMGEILRAMEQWWIDRDFRPSREECLAEAKVLMNEKN